MRIKLLLAMAFVGFVALGVSNIKVHNQNLQLKDVQLKSKSADLKKLELNYQQLNVNLDTELQQKNQNKDKLIQLEAEKAKLQQQLDQAERDLEARAVAKSQLASLQTAQKVYAATALTCGDNWYANYIYMHESGCSTSVVNSIGCKGVGQSCPASKIAHCGDDYICQNAWFTNYATQKYGGWEQAYEYWLQHRWW